MKSYNTKATSSKQILSEHGSSLLSLRMVGIDLNCNAKQLIS